MNISARFYLNTLTYGRERYSWAELQPVTRGEHNKPWSTATPSGRMKLASLTPAERDWLAAQIDNRPHDGYGCEFDVFITSEELSHTVRRPVRVSGITNMRQDGKEARIHLTGTLAWTEVELYITNLAALEPLVAQFQQPDHTLWLSLR